MRIITTLIFLGHTSFSIGQSTLSITPYFCQSWNNISYNDYKIALYKDGTLITSAFYPVNDFTVDSLQQGTYIIKYNTIFNQPFEKTIKLDKRSKSITICIDEFRKIREKTFIEELQPNDTLEIWVYETGCEYTDWGKLQLIKKGNTMNATLIDWDSIVHRRVFNKRQLATLEHIEQKIHLVQANEEDGFLRTTHYEIRLNGTELVNTKFGLEATGYASKMKELFNIVE